MTKKKKDHPPKLANWLLSSFVQAEFHEEFLGDLQEMYNDRNAIKGPFTAKLMYWVDALHLLFGFSSLKIFSNHNPIIMYQHYLTVAYRNLLRNKLYSLINILSLAVGIGICLLIFQYIYFELSYDKFHHNHQNIYRVVIEETNSESNKIVPTSGWALGENAKKEIPEIKAYVRKNRFNRGAVVTNPTNQTVFNEDMNDLLFVDASFFQVFNFPVQKGDPKSLFDDKYSVVLTEEAAKKYFGADDPIGKTLNINGPPSSGNYTVTGVLNDLPENSHLQFDFLMPIDNYIEYGWGGAVKKQGGWNGFSVVTYLHIEENADIDLVSKKLTQLVAQNKRKSNTDRDIVKKVILQAVGDIYLKSDQYDYAGFINQTGDLQNIRTFSIISLIILFIAWINYINLSTARAMKRAKEVGIRKAIGAFKKQLISQFLFESILINIVAALLAIGITSLGLPVLNKIVDKEIELSLLTIPMFWIVFITVILVGAMISGLYPAFVLSSFKPISMLKAHRTGQVGNMNLRKSLIAFQFLTSLVLISATYLVYKQTSFLKNQELNIDIEQIVVLRSQQGNINESKVESNFNAFKDEMMRHHSISSISSSVYTPGQFGVTLYRREGQLESEAPYTRSIFAGHGFSKTYGLSFMAGSPFNSLMPTEEVVIINESASKAYGFDSPEDAIQQKLVVGNNNKTIVGVVENFHWHSFKESYIPYVIALGNASQHQFISVKINMAGLDASLAQMESQFNTFFPGQPFEYYFADDAFNRQYHAETQFGSIFFFFSILAIFIACIGLFALVSYSATLRGKEIGIRKVLGANTSNLMMLLSKEYLFLLLVANVLAIPLVLYGGKTWLNNYAFRVELSIENIILPGLVLLFIALFTVGYTIYSAAKRNPIDSLSRE